MPQYLIREATIDDTPQILTFIKELAAYEKLADKVVATEDILRESLFGANPKAFTVFAEIDDTPVGFALYFYNFSTFLGKPGLYVEDVYVRPNYRGNGIGKQLFQYLAHKAVTENCGRMAWWVLDWNEPSIAFYKKLGAVLQDEWTTYWLEGKPLQRLAKESKNAAS